MEVIVKPNKKYDNDWMPAIPKNWDLKKTTWVFEKIGSGTTPKSENPEYYDNGDINWILTGDLNDSYLKSTPKKITQKALKDFSTLKIYPRNSLVIAMYGATIGKIALTDIDACTNQACCVLSEPINSNTKFYFYWFLANRQHIISLGYGGGQPNISQEIIKSLRLPCPPITEQKKIVKFLDQKCAMIDSLIEKKQKLVELKKEERTALINQAVTKGLDPNAPMKDSGIEWLGEIPEHWKVKKLKYVVSNVQTGVTPPSNEEVYYVDGDIDWYAPGDFNESLILKESNKKITKFAINKGVARLYEAKSVLLVGIGATIGKVGIIKKPASSNQQINAITFNEDYNPYFGAYYIRSIEDVIKKLSNSATLGIFNQSQTKNILVPVLPKGEQDLIVNYIQESSSRFEQVITNINKQIELLKEYKTTLISEAVTGKLVI